MASSTLAVPELAHFDVQPVTRAGFLLRSSLAAGAVFGAGAVSPFIRQAIAQDGGDLEILNFALTLEYLETEFYETAGKRVKLSSDVRALAKRLAEDEAEHVSALTGAIKTAGGKPAKKPTFAFGGAFASESAFLKVANVLEDTGVSAYNGAGPGLKSKDILAAAGSIVQIEARHAALIRLARNKPPAPRAFDMASTMDEVLAAAGGFIKS
jgi:rubrerythrin